MPITNSRVRDARPQINAEAESEAKLFTADISKGFVELRRGKSKGALLRVKYAEVNELEALLDEVSELLDKNQYDPAASLSEGYVAGEGRYTPLNPTGPRKSSTEDATVAAPQAEQSIEAGQSAGEGTNTPAETVATTGQPAPVEQPAQQDQSNPFAS